MAQKEQPAKKAYWSPYLAGSGIGLTLILTYYVMGHGLGASGAYTQVAAKMLQAEAPRHAAANPYLKNYLQLGPLLQSWIVIEMVGVFLGGVVGTLTARRLRFEIERGPNIAIEDRLLWAFFGGAVVGFGSRVAQGCTSGQALSGGAVLAVGSWFFTLTFFLGGYLFAWLARREWR